MDTAANAANPQPWIKAYPSGIAWDTPIDTTPVFEQVLAVCARHPDNDALDFLGRKTRFGELGRAINAFAGALQSQFGVRKGTRVALLLPNTPFYVVAYYAVQRAGGIVVNCNPLYTVPELSHLVSDSGAELMVTLDLKQLFEKAEALVEAGHVRALIACHFPDALPRLKKLLYTLAKRQDLSPVKDSRIAAKVTHYADMIRRNETPAPVTIDPATDVAVQQYTGGTTGQPKGAMLSHANVAANRSQLETWSMGLFLPPTRVVAVLPFFHIFAMTTCMNLPLCNGAQVVMLPRFELKALLALLTRTGTNILIAVPTLIHAILKAGETAKPHLQALDVAISGGSAMPEETYVAWAAISKSRLAEGYGLTEASPVVSCAALHEPSRHLSVGQPLPGTNVRFVDVDTGQPVAPGERGELQIKGPQVMLGYHNDPEATRDVFVDGWLRTGDVGYMDEDGYIFLVDRIKDLIITSGFNIYPRTIEVALDDHPAVDECNVIGVPDTYRGEAPVAFVKLREGSEATEAEIKSFLAGKLNKLEMPREIIFKDALPKTLIGKLSKKELREEYQQRKGQTSESA